MQRQLQNRGGMTVGSIRQKYGLGSLVGREKFGLGSDFQDFKDKALGKVRDIIPNELADVAVKAAPFVAPFNPLAAAAMRGIGRFDQRGSISDALKQGAGTFAFGYGARKLGGADGIGGFSMDSFSSPLSAERTEAIGSLFKSDPAKAKNLKDADKGLPAVKTITEKTVGNIPIVNKLPKFVQQQLLVGGITAGASLLASYFQGDFREQEEGETMEDYLAARKEAVGGQMRTYMDNYFKFDSEYSTMTDKQKNAFVARYNVRDGGRIGFQGGSKDNATKINELVDGGMDMEKAIQKIAPGTKSSVEFTREELGLGPLKINQDIDRMLRKGVDIEIIKSMTGAPDELIQERIQVIRYSKAKGGLMGIPVRKNSEGTTELDYRKSGGFVPIGVKEKADDVPAMLSKNEFVMTADAVRAAGGGSIEKGAQRMYDTMKKLESRIA